MSIQTYVITAHIEFPSKTQPIQTGQIRMEIPAASEDEARIKAMSFISAKTKVVIEKAENKATKDWLDSMLKMASGVNPGMGQAFGDAFKGFGKK